jgi:hypothetical protein
MWGNSLGWMISACIAIAMGAWLWLLAASATPVPPTAFTKDPQNLAAMALPPVPDGALPPRQSCDAGPLYRQAIEMYQAERTIYEDFSRLGKLSSPDVAKLKAIDLLVQAAKCDEMKLFTPRPQELITYANMKPPLEALQHLSVVCVDRLGLLNEKANQRDKAMQYYQAGLAMGRHLTNERLTYGEFQLGLELLSKSSVAVSRLAAAMGNDALASSLRNYDGQRIGYVEQRVAPMVRILRSIDPNIVGRHSGDVFEIAQRSQERMWRVEALMSTGRVRHFAGAGGTKGNQRFANGLLMRTAENDADPIIRFAASAGRDLTVEQHRAQ